MVDSPLLELILSQIPQHILNPLRQHQDRITEFLAPHWDTNFYNGIAVLGEGQDGGMQLSTALQNFERDSKRSGGRFNIYVIFMRYNFERAKSVLETPVSRRKGQRARSQREGTYRSKSQKPMKSIEEVVDLTSSENGNDWYEMEDFKDFPAADELLNPRKVRASSKASTTLKSLQSFQSKYQDIEEQHEAEEEDEDIITPTPATRELPRLKLTLSLKKDRTVVRVTLWLRRVANYLQTEPKPPQSPLSNLEASSPVFSPPSVLPPSPQGKRNHPGDSPNAQSPGAVRNLKKAAEQRARGREDQRDLATKNSSNRATGKGKGKGRDKSSNMGADEGPRRSRRRQDYEAEL